ncbi:MAG: c-type cytochrome, partial [Planctomycetaceae bacterium]|nr:c-type cytochrome [Planctomycetaceae bacterium]
MKSRTLNPTFLVLTLMFTAVRGLWGADPPRADEREVFRVSTRARRQGDPKRGALLFHKSPAACSKCHSVGESASPLGPDLTTIDPNATNAYLVEAILKPSKVVRKGFETVSVLTDDGAVRTGIVTGQSESAVGLRELARLEEEITIPKTNIDEIVVGETSLMPEGLAATLHEERDLFDLVRYVTEVARGGKVRAAQLHPRPEDLLLVDDT